jgi:hypothetical protein
VAKDGIVILALCNAGYLDLLLNWKASVDRLNITNYVIVPNDIKAAQELSFLGNNPTPRPMFLGRSPYISTLPLL